MLKLVKIFFLFCFIEVVWSSARKFNSDLKAGTKTWHDACVMFTGATDDMIKDIKNGKFDDNNMTIKRYNVCLWRYSNVMDVFGEIDLERIRKMFPKENDVKIYDQCNDEFMEGDAAEKREFIENAWLQEKCLYDRLKDVTKIQNQCVTCAQSPHEVQELERVRLEQEGPFVIVWKRGTTLVSAGQQLISMDPRISLIGYNLQLKDIRHADQGDYTCQIGDGSQGDLIHTIEILMPPSIQILPPNGQVVTRKGGPVSFECKTNGNPTPTVQWSKKDGLLPSGHQVETGYLLNLNDVQRQDAGAYQCTASNGIGQPVTGEIKLHVLYPPEVSVIRTWVNAGEGGEAKLDCVVHADPPAEVTWYQDSFILQPTDRRVMTKNGNTYTLSIRNVQSSDFGNYSCVVSNSIGRDKRYMELSGKPGPAKIISGPYSNPHEYDLKWIVQSVFPIIEVRILYRRIMSNASYHHLGQWHDLLVKPPQTYNPQTSERSQRYQLANLFPDSVYECLIQTKNQHGFGELSDLHQWSTSPRGRYIMQNGSEGGLVRKHSRWIGILIWVGLLML